MVTLIVMKRVMKKLKQELLLDEEGSDLVRHLMDDNHRGGKNAQYQKKIIKTIDGIIDSLYDPNDPANKRCFPRSIKEKVLKKQDNKCNMCGKEICYSDCQADHIVSWSEGGMTVIENCQGLCKPCHDSKASY